MSQLTLWLFNIAMENGQFIDGWPIKMLIFHGHVNVYQAGYGGLDHHALSRHWKPRLGSRGFVDLGLKIET